MKYMASALIIIALLIIAAVLIIESHPFWAAVFVLLTSGVKVYEK